MAHHQPRIKSPHQPRIKSPPLQSMMKALQSEAEQTKHHLLRRCLLLLLMLSAGGSLLRLATTLPSDSSLIQPSDSRFHAERSREMDSLKTHISFAKNHLQSHQEEERSASSPACSSLIDGIASSTTNGGLLCCDRSHQRTDVCYMNGDIRTDANSSSIMVYGTTGDGNSTVETIRPYTRKWETEIMKTIDEITLHRMPVGEKSSIADHQCDVRHKVPAIMFSTGGYTGNVYHEFNDGLIPLYITAERFKGEVVLVVLEYHSWWKTKFQSVVKKLSNYRMIDFSNDRRVHCFPEMIVGLKIHGELTIDPKLMHDGKGIQDFQSLLGEGFGGYQQIQPQLRQAATRPKIAIFTRHRSRMLQNQKELVRICKKIGFDVEILDARRTTPLSEIYAVLNSSHAMMAVHGAAMTHFLFMRPGSVLIQIVPLGLHWPAEAYYGEPARNLGLRYIAYKIAPEESSLSRQYDRRSEILRDPEVITSKGWSETKKIYLESQNVRLNLRKFSRVIANVHSQIVHRLQNDSKQRTNIL